MTRFKLTSAGKIFFIVIIFVAILIFATSLMSKKPASYAFCVPDCSPKLIPIGAGTLIHGCYLNQADCQTAQTTTTTAVVPTSGLFYIGFAVDDLHRVPAIGSVTMLDLNVTQIYVTSDNQTWTPLLLQPKYFNMSSLANQTAIVASAILTPQNYTGEKVVFGDSQIKINSLAFNIYNRTSYPLYPAMNETKTYVPFTSLTSSSTLLIFNITSANSIEHTANGYMFNPSFTFSIQTLPTDQQPTNSVFIS